MVPYLYTRVQCCGSHGDLASKYDITDFLEVADILQEATSLGLPEPHSEGSISACAVPKFPPHSRLWSQSPGCPNKAFVQDSAQWLFSINLSLVNLAMLVILPIGGTIADACGRKPVLLAYSCAALLACIVYTLDSKLFDVWGDAPLLISGMILAAARSPMVSVIVGAVSDLLGHNAFEKRNAFALIIAFCQIGVFICMTGSFFVLKFHLENYFLLWLVSSLWSLGTVIYVWCIIPETLPKELQTGFEWHMTNPIQTQLNAFGLVMQDMSLMMLMAYNFLSNVSFAGIITTSSFYMLMLGFTQEGLILPIMCGTIITMLSSIAVSRCGNSMGIANGIIIASILSIGYYIVAGPVSIEVGKVGLYIANGLGGAGFAFFVPSAEAIISSRVAAADQAKCQSTLSFASSIGGIIGPIVWSRFLFDATAKGMAMATPFIAGAMVNTVCWAIAMTMRSHLDADNLQASTKLLHSAGTKSEDSAQTFYGSA